MSSGHFPSLIAQIVHTSLTSGDVAEIERILLSDQFRKLQQSVGLQMGLFAFIDPADPEDVLDREEASRYRPLHYLAGDSAQRADGERVGTLRIPYLVETKAGAWETDPLTEAKRLVLQASRQAEHARLHRYPLFVRALRAYEAGSPSGPDAHRLSSYERALDVLFAPCGELSFFCLGWLLRRVLSPEIASQAAGLTARRVERFLQQPVAEMVDSNRTREELDMFALAERFDALPALEQLYPLHRVTTVRDVLLWLGLLDAESRCTERFANLLSWLRAMIGASIRANARLVETLGRDDRFRADSPAASEVDLDPFPIPKAYRSTDLYRQLIALENAGRDADALALILDVVLADPSTPEIFRSRARFVLEGHIALRSYETFERSWLVMPVLLEHRTLQRPDGSDTPRQRTGFFLGTIAAGDNQLLGDKWENQISEVRAIVQPLADVAARSFYWPGVFRQSVETQELKRVFAALAHEFKKQAGKILIHYDQLLLRIRDSDGIAEALGIKSAGSEDRARLGIERIQQRFREIALALAGSAQSSVNKVEEMELEAMLRELIDDECESTSYFEPVDIPLTVGEANGRCLVPEGVSEVIRHIVLPELLRNAIAWAPAGSGTIRVSCSADDETWAIEIKNEVEDERVPGQDSTQLGLHLVEIICRRYGLEFLPGRNDDKPRVVRIGGLNARNE